MSCSCKLTQDRLTHITQDLQFNNVKSGIHTIKKKSISSLETKAKKTNLMFHLLQALWM